MMFPNKNNDTKRLRKQESKYEHTQFVWNKRKWNKEQSSIAESINISCGNDVKETKWKSTARGKDIQYSTLLCLY